MGDFHVDACCHEEIRRCPDGDLLVSRTSRGESTVGM